MERKIVVTISREYGSGGREVARLLAEMLNIPFYDKELLTYLAKSSGLDPELLKTINDKIEFTSFYFGDNDFKFKTKLHDLGTLGIHERIQSVQEKLIMKLAQESCVIVGRCSDYILRNDSDVIDVYIRGDLMDKKARAIHIYGEPIENVNERLFQIDKKRANYYNYFTDRTWGKLSNYDLVINSGKLELIDCVKTIKTYIDNRK